MRKLYLEVDGGDWLLTGATEQLLFFCVSPWAIGTAVSGRKIKL